MITTKMDGKLVEWFIPVGPKNLNIQIKASIYAERLWRVNVVLQGGQEISRFGTGKSKEQCDFECRVNARELAVKYYGLSE